MSEGQNRHKAIAGGTVSAYAGAVVMFAMIPHVDGVLAYLVGAAGVITFIGASLLLFSIYLT